MSNDYHTYKKLRAEGYSANIALKLIKKPDLFSIYGAVMYYSGTEFGFGDFEMKVTLEEDSDPYFDLLGEFSDDRG